MSQADINTIIAFRRIAEAIDALAEEDVGKLSDPNFLIGIKITRNKTKNNLIQSIDQEDLDLAIKKLIGYETREEASMFLLNNYPTRKLLEPIARKLDIPIIKQDKIEILREKIVEATVGAKIRSQAIQGKGAPSSGKSMESVVMVREE